MILVTAISCNGQNSNQTEFTYENFEKQIINYEPKQKGTVLKKDFDFGIMVLNVTKDAVKGNPVTFNLTDHWNILTVFLTLKESDKNIKLAFEKFKNFDGSCEYFIDFENSVVKNSVFDIIRDEYNRNLKKCKDNQIEKPEFNIENHISENKFNPNLVKIIYKIHLDDQKFRNADAKKSFKLKQPELDRKNQILIDSLFNKYNTYIGKGLVGKEKGLNTVMWSVIQHSNPEMMERYLPVVHKAVENKELDVVPLKMMIDRFYGLKYGYQIFGSQNGFGFKMADEKKRKEIELEYGIEN